MIMNIDIHVHVCVVWTCLTSSMNTQGRPTEAGPQRAREYGELVAKEHIPGMEVSSLPEPLNRTAASVIQECGRELHTADNYMYVCVCMCCVFTTILAQHEQCQQHRMNKSTAQ